MKYQLSRDGKMLGEFTLDELRDGRATDTFNGWEFVWIDSTSAWQPIDEFIKVQQQRPRTTPPPIPLTAAQKRTRILIVVGSLIGVLFISSLVVFGTRVVNVVQRMRQLSGRTSRTEAVAEARKPVAVSTNTMTHVDVTRRKLEFRRRQWIEGYLQNADHSSACDAQSLEYFETWLAATYGSGPLTNRASHRELGERLAAATGCEDPLVLTLTGVEAANPTNAIERLERALKLFPTSRHKAYAHFYAAVTLADKLYQQPERAAKLDALAVDQFRTCFADGSFQPGDAPEIAELLLTGWGEAFFRRNARTVTALAAVDKSPSWEWLTLVLSGEHHIREAWRARGGGYADSVTAEGWQKFNSELGEAQSCLSRAWRLRPDLPLAPARMIYVSLGLADITEMRQWFDRAVAAQIDYSRAWADLRWGLRPRWYGSLEAMRDFGIVALNTGRFDTDVPRMLFDSISDVESEMELSPREHIYGRADIWPYLERMYEGYVAAPSQTERRKGWRTSFAIVAYLAGKPQVARAQLEALEWKLQPGNLETWRTDLSLMPLEVAARTGSLAQEITAAEDWRDGEEWTQALTAYRKLADDTRTDQRTQLFVKHRVAMLDLETCLHRGEWVRFLPQVENDPAWKREMGSYRVLPDGAVEVTSTNRGHMLVCRAWVGDAFEVRGEFEPVAPVNGKFQAGLVMGLPNRSNYDWLAFRFKRGRRESQFASYSKGWTSQQKQEKISLNETRNTFEFQFREGQIQATVNGQPVHRNTAAPASINHSTDEFLVGLGAYDESNDVAIRYHNVEVRLLSATNAPTKLRGVRKR